MRAVFNESASKAEQKYGWEYNNRECMSTSRLITQRDLVQVCVSIFNLLQRLERYYYIYRFKPRTSWTYSKREDWIECFFCLLLDWSIVHPLVTETAASGFERPIEIGNASIRLNFCDLKAMIIHLILYCIGWITLSGFNYTFGKLYPSTIAHIAQSGVCFLIYNYKYVI